MKRLLALLLVLLLPCAALGETWHTDVSLSVHESALAELLTPMLSDLLGMETAEEGTALAAAAAGLLNGLGLRVDEQEDAAQVSLLVGGKTLIDFTAYDEAERMVLTSGLMRGYGLTLPAEEDTSVQVDWQQLFSAMMEAGMQSIQGIESTRTQGAFSGDAYTGGVYCDTYLFDDSDVSALLKSLMTPELCAAAAELLGAAGLDASAILADLDSRHEQVAADNLHAYVLRLVWDAELLPVGLSLTVLRGQEQLATLSCGVLTTDDESLIRLVLGASSGEQNCWYDHTIRIVSGASTHYEGTCIQLTGEKDEAFAYASAVVSEPLSPVVWQMDIEVSGDVRKISYEHEAVWSGSEWTERVVSVSEQNTVDGSFMHATTLFVDEAELGMLNVSHTLCEALPVRSEELTLCDMSSTDEEQLILQDEISDLMAQVFTARLLVLLPMDVLMNLPALFQ